MINGYPAQASVFPGDSLRLHVSTDAPDFRVELYRQEATLALLLTSDWRVGVNAPDHDPDEDWGVDSTRRNELRRAWPAYDFPIPTNWRSGVYIAMLIEGDGAGNPRGNTPPLDKSIADARSGKALFVVRSPAPGVCARILYKLSLLTYQAYNYAGGASLYQTAPVSLLRPGGGTGGTPWDFLWGYYNPGNPSVPLQSFAQWDAPFIAWLEKNGYSVDYATDVDLHLDARLLDSYGLALSVGHDEYFTEAMRDRCEAYIAGGGNFAFFSGNTCWWRVIFDDPVRFRRALNWFDPNGPNRPENSLTAVSYRNAGEGDRDRPSIGYVAQHADHWVYAGTGLNEGNSFGQEQLLVGYECDGANFDRNQGPPFAPKLDDGTPPSFAILGVGDVTSFNGKENNAAATMGVYTQGGTVFTAATTDWPRVVGLNGEPRTVQITRNVLARLSGVDLIDVSSIAGRSLSPSSQLTNWQTPDGQYNVEHLAGTDAGGNVVVFFWSPQADWQSVEVSQISVRKLAPWSPLTSWQTPDGPYNVEHLAGTDADGNVVVFFWSPQANWQSVEVSQVAGRKLAPSSPLSSWQTPDGPYNVEHLAGTDADGNVVVFFWSPQADWQSVDVSSIARQTLTAGSRLGSWQAQVHAPQGDLLAEKLLGLTSDGSLCLLAWTPPTDWCAQNLSLLSSASFASGVTSWQVPDGPRLAEHVAGLDANGHVIVVVWE